MGYLLKEALKTLCGVNQWSYAVFWKMGSQNPKLLIWEECYYDAAASSCGLQGFSRNGNPEFDFQDYYKSSITFDSIIQPDVPPKDKVHFLVNKMMVDGNVKVVGEGLVGSVAFTGNYRWILSENYCGEPHSIEVLKEALQQFSSGMQTVTVIPVLPHGVVQFGSHATIPENIGFVNDVMSLILELGQIPGMLHSENREPNEVVARVLPLGSNSNTISTSSFSTGSFKSSPFGNNHPSSQASNLVAQSLNPYEAKIGVSQDSNVWANMNIQSSSSTHTRLPDGCSPQTGLKDSIVDQSRDDLYSIFDANFKKNMLSTTLNGHARNEPGNISFPEIYPAGPVKLESGILSFNRTDHLLDAVVSKGQFNTSFDKSVSCASNLTNISSSSASKALLPQWFAENFNHMKGESFGAPINAAKGKEVSTSFSQGSCVFDPWAEKGLSKPSTTSKPIRKRAKPGENPRPRPRDRQMIQDRVKELREIVPNGAKCSIDCLLERTIKHMIFLQGVSKHADKMNQNAESSSVLKDNSRGGTTWAYEVGSQSMACPIIVEDINHQPHQMLVEMICEETGSFLEIAGIIRGLGLTILKGLMENRDGKVSARFTVEANRNVTRMEIFLSLARLLGQNAKPGFSRPNIKTESVMAHDCRQAASVIC